MRRLSMLSLLLLLLPLIVGCSLSLGGDSKALPTHTPQPNEPTPQDDIDPPPITSSDDCQNTASASGVTIDAEQIRTLPNGRVFPGNPPKFTGLPGNQPVRDQILIRFTDGSSQQERNAYIQSIGGRSRRNIDKLNTYVVTVPPNTNVYELPASPIVELIEPDYVASAMQAGTPNDPRYAEQWALPVMGVPGAWNQLPDNMNTIIVAVIDSGVCLDHPDMAGRFVAGYDFIEEDNTPQDQLGHGCGVAGIIAANTNNGNGMAGIAPNAQIMPLRVLDRFGSGNYSDIAAAIVYAADNGAKIINLSLGGTNNSQIIADAVAYAASKDIVLVAAAGNSGTDIPFYPAALPAVIAVGSIDSLMQRSPFSNYGAYIDMQAPGSDILTTNLNGDYELMSGTSFAAPQVSGMAVMADLFDLPLNTEDGVVFLYPPDNIPDCE